jgi:histidine triad (HIT) family protein
MSDCVFCKIAEGTLPSRKVYEDELVVAFWDAHPAAPIHILIVPRKHIPTLNDLTDGDELLAHMGRVARQIAEGLGVAQTGYRFFVNVNRGGGQVVFHLHAHIVAGKDLGTFFLNLAVVIAILWRKVVSLVRGNGVPRDRFNIGALQNNHCKSPVVGECVRPSHMTKRSS